MKMDGIRWRKQTQRAHSLYLTWLIRARDFRRHREGFTSGKAEALTFVGVVHVSLSLSVVHLIHPRSVLGAVGNMLSYWKIAENETVYVLVAK